jgi:hypothetical protein
MEPWRSGLIVENFYPQGAEIAPSLFLKFRAYIFLFYVD